ncbi:hypothetical protein P280DRAFT_415198 [Massarina eburnea CBS 473.64]|uniref:Uncharacterized protein n=1 Tax=Massarina eburnea CBS 473.64 TaxID=1395130 RepID=A0A6A6SIY7_9PLEO|nr:hypothetical protein P280DRAFT_415198 [Massarina eburnea CBS 473.64]
MATARLDGLLDFLLSEIAVCGVQGADSKDFRRFVDDYFGNSPKIHVDGPAKQSASNAASVPLHPSFYEKAWNWVVTHPDIRIFDGEKVYHLSLSGLESLERGAAETGQVETPERNVAPYRPIPSAIQQLQPSGALSSLGGSLRERILAESSQTTPKYTPQVQAVPSSTAPSIVTHHAAHDSSVRAPRKTPEGVQVAAPKFDELSSSIKTPRIFASQNRVWQTITGHSMDLKKVPTMEFICLCVIAAHGPGGILQPDLVRITGQDKRSVPKRTDDLADKGYIEKKPIQSSKMRTSLCVHKKFVKSGHFLTQPKSFGDVFGAQNKFVPSGFLYLLHKLLTDTPVVPMRDLRKRMGVPANIWNGRGVRSLINRLAQTEYIKRVLAPKKGSGKMLVCIKLLRDPTEGDIKNLKFRRNHSERAQPEEILEEDAENDVMDRDMDLSLIDDVDSEPDGHFDDDYRIPPQWTPDRLLTNLMFDATVIAGPDGHDTAELRDITMGKFWKRPLESMVSRLVDDWEKSQLPHLRHLAIIKDTTVTTDKKYAHYIYRTYGNFQAAVDVGDARWEGVSKEAHTKSTQSNKKTGPDVPLDSWGFSPLNVKEFLRQNGASSLSDSRRAIVHKHPTNTHWDNALWKKIGNEKPMQYQGKKRQSQPKTSRSLASAKKQPNFTATPVPLVGEDQGDFHEQALDNEDDTSTATLGREPRNVVSAKYKSPVLTAQERIARGLPPRGRLTKALEAQIREEKGLPAKPTKEKKPRYRRAPGEKALLTPDQRVAKGLPANGRLSERIITELRRLRDAGLDPSSIVLPIPDDKTAHKHSDTASPAHNDVAFSVNGNLKKMSADHEQTPLEERPLAPSAEPLTRPSFLTSSPVPSNVPKKRVASLARDDSQGIQSETPHTKRLRTASSPPQADAAITGVEKSILISPHPTVSRAPRRKQKTPDNRALQPLKVLETQNHHTIRNPADTTEPGFYYDADATRASAGRGRPRSAFIGIIKSARLQSFSWFQSEPTAFVVRFSNAGLITPTSARQVNLDNVSDKEPHQTNDATSHIDLSMYTKIHPNPSDNVVKTPRENTSPVQSPVPLALQSVPVGRRSSIQQVSLEMADDRLSNIPQQVFADALENKSPAVTIQGLKEPEERLQGISRARFEVSPQEPLDAAPESLETAEQVSPSTLLPQSSELPVQQSSGVETQDLQCNEPVASIAEPSQGQPLLAAVLEPPPRHQQQHHIECSDQVGSESPNAPAAEDVHMGNTQDNSIPTPGLSGDLPGVTHSTQYVSPYTFTPTPIPTAFVYSDRTASPTPTNVSVVAPQPVQEKQDQRNKRGVVIGRGNVYHFRTLIIKDIIELCHGVVPHNREILDVFGEMWKERAPKKMACPERGTMLKTLKAMVNDPSQNMRKYTFTFTTEGGNTVNKAIIAYKHFEFHSPEVQGVYRAIMQAHPNKYYPPEIHHYVREEQKKKQVPITVDESIELPEVQSAADGILARRIRDATKRRETTLQRQQHQKPKGRQVQDRVRMPIDATERPQRSRLVGLNVASLQKPSKVVSQHKPLVASKATEPNEHGLDPTSSSEDDDDGDDNIPLAQLLLRRNQTMAPSTSTASLDEISVSSQSDLEPSSTDNNVSTSSVQPMPNVRALVSPGICFYSSSGTFSTDFNSAPTAAETKGHKQAKPNPERHAKKARLRRRNGDEATVTLVQRLTGLTGDSDEPDYQPPSRKQTLRNSAEKNERRQNRRNELKNQEPKDRKYEEVLDPINKFKNTLCALVVASSMSGEDGLVDWDIVGRTCGNQRTGIARMKKLWLWIQENMATQLSTFTETFQSNFLKAYENGEIARIVDPATYDWANLVRWATRHCEYTELPLPMAHDALDHYDVDITDYQVLSRSSWYRNNIASVWRSRNLHDYAFAAPLHSNNEKMTATEEKNGKARALIRANIATPKELYNKNLAHNKLRPIGESILEGVVQDFVDASFIRKWKLKRLRPGRNYEFAPKFAVKYRRTFELGDFMSAAELKKHLDLTFAAGHAFTISRTADDGAVMALLSLVSNGHVKLVPRLPPTKNDLKAPHPRISVWGFSEGDYLHRQMSRHYLFWQVDAIPTDTYLYGNPLQPSPFPRPPKSDGTPADWEELPTPPLPGRDNSDALIPIWSTIDGQHVIYPWWNRILSLVVQCLIFQPSSTASEIFSQCPRFTTELFEIELVLYWLEKIKAVRQTPRGTYEVLSSLWAVFGDRLIDDENDTFGDHVKRKWKNKKLEPTWRTKYNMQFSTLQQRQEALQNGTQNSDDEASEGESRRLMTQQIIKNSRSQYRIAREAIRAPPATKAPKKKVGRSRKAALPASQPDQDGDGDVDMVEAPASKPRKRKRVSGDGAPKPAKKKRKARPKKVELAAIDPNLDAMGDDVDAEGESDDEYTVMFGGTVTQ